MLPSIFGESLFDDWMDFPFTKYMKFVHKLFTEKLALTS